MEIAAGSLVLIVEQVFVHPFKVQGVVECLTDSNILEYRTLCIENKSLSRGWRLVSNFLFLNQTLVKITTSVRGRPELGLVLFT
ncbi:Uncharacterised protein [Vibrio cholerae]|nr:Uncharacterised protein [Vibrio cholerae]